jgi:hypothetical protein
MKLQVNLNLAGITIPQKIENAGHYITQMTGNVSFPSPFPTLASVNNTAALLKSAYDNAQKGGHTQAILLKQADEVMDKDLTQLGSYVVYIANGNEAILESAGMHAKKQGRGIPLVLGVENGRTSGEVILTTPAIGGAAYTWQVSDSPLTTADAKWAHLKVATSAKVTIDRLTQGTQYWFRVCTVVKNVESDWSDPISVIVL